MYPSRWVLICMLLFPCMTPAQTSQPTPSGDQPVTALQKYNDLVNGVSFHYPDSWLLNQAGGAYFMPVILDKGNPAPEGDPDYKPTAYVVLVGRDAKDGPYRNTNFYNGWFLYRIAPELTETECYQKAAAPILQDSNESDNWIVDLKTIGGVRFRHGSGGEQGLCNQTREDVFTTFHGGRCYLFEKQINTNCPVEGNRNITPRELGVINQAFDAVMQSLRFEDISATKNNSAAHACKTSNAVTSVQASCAAHQVTIPQNPTIRHVCMWNEAVCRNGTMVSIGLVAADSDMSRLDSLRDVKELYFQVGPDRAGAAKIDDLGFAHIRNLHDLEVLHAMDLPFLTDDALRSLSNLRSLREIRFEDDRNFSDAGLAFLQHLKNLQTVTFYGDPFTDRGILYLRESADLEDLQLGLSLVTDEGAREIVAQFHNLKTLDLQGSNITDGGVAAIATLPHLEWLCLRNTSVTDSGILALRSMSTLRDLYITPGSLRDETIAALEHSLPELKIHFQ
jgi:hypothetical protein